MMLMPCQSHVELIPDPSGKGEVYDFVVVPGEKLPGC